MHCFFHKYLTAKKHRKKAQNNGDVIKSNSNGS